MNINKDIVLGSIDVDTDNNTIWVNSQQCLLRINNVNFKNIVEKFSMIEINGNNATMIPGFSEESFGDFMKKVMMAIYPISDKNEEFLNGLLKTINHYTEEHNGSHS